MNLDQIANELRQMPDSALQQQSQSPGAVPGYLVADEIQRRNLARNAPQQQGITQPKPTVLQILGNNLPPPQAPMTKPQPQVPFGAVPQNSLANMPTQPQHLDSGGEVDPSDEVAMNNANALYMAPGTTNGLVSSGNIDLTSLPAVDLGNGRWGTVNSASREVNGREVLYPTIVNGRQMSDDDAFKYAQQTGRNLGTFKDGDAADAYAQRLHEDWQAGKIPRVAMPSRNVPVWSMPQHFAPGGEIPDYTGDPSDEVADNNSSSSPSAPVPTWTPGYGSTPMSEQVPSGVNSNSPGAYAPPSQPPITSYPQTSTSPIVNPPNTHQGGRSFLQTLASLAPALQYVGNIGAGAAQPHGNFASGVGYANQVQQQQQEAKQRQDLAQAELALRQQSTGMEGQKLQMEGLQAGAKFIGPDGKVQEAPVAAPMANINGVPMGGGQIAGSDAVPSNPQMSQMVGAPGYGGKPMDFSDMLTEQKKVQLAQQNQYAEKEHEAGLEVAKAQALWIKMPKELAGQGLVADQPYPPSVVEARLKEMNPALETHWETNNKGDSTLLVRNPVDGAVKTQTFAGVGPNKDEMTAAQQSMADHRDAMLAASIARVGANAENKGTQYFSVPSDPNDPNSPRTLQAVKPGEQIPAGALSSTQAGSQQVANAKDLKGGQSALNYANDYLKSGNFTGAGDEALMEKYFELAKPSSGFRMSQQQIQMLKDSRSWMDSIAGQIHHATVGTWFSDNQRKQMADTMQSLEQAKPGIKTNSSQAPVSGGETHPVGTVRTSNVTGKSDKWDGTKWIPQ